MRETGEGVEQKEDGAQVSRHGHAQSRYLLTYSYKKQKGHKSSIHTLGYSSGITCDAKTVMHDGDNHLVRARFSSGSMFEPF